MKSISTAIAILLMLGLLLGLGWAGYITSKFLFSQFSMVDSQTSAILTISTVTVLLSAIIIAAAIKSSAKSTENSNHPRKLELYSQLVDVLQNYDQKNPLPLEELRSHIIIWGSDSVLEEFNNYLDLVNSSDPTNISKQQQKVVAAIRQDVRKENSKIDSSKLTTLLSRES